MKSKHIALLAGGGVLLAAAFALVANLDRTIVDEPAFTSSASCGNDRDNPYAAVTREKYDGEVNISLAHGVFNATIAPEHFDAAAREMSHFCKDGDFSLPQAGIDFKDNSFKPL